jgi:hypothetical protein
MQLQMPGQIDAYRVEPGSQIIIYTKKPHKKQTKRTAREQEKITSRRREAGPKFDETVQILMNESGGNLSREWLMARAKSVARAKNIKVDRDLQRYKEGLILWLCENAYDDNEDEDEDERIENDSFDFDASFDCAASFEWEVGEFDDYWTDHS